MGSINFLKSIHLKGIQIRLASPESIRRWAERKLPNGKIIGQVTSSQTVNYQKYRNMNYINLLLNTKCI